MPFLSLTSIDKVYNREKFRAKKYCLKNFIFDNRARFSFLPLTILVSVVLHLKLIFAWQFQLQINTSDFKRKPLHTN